MDVTSTDAIVFPDGALPRSMAPRAAALLRPPGTDRPVVVVVTDAEVAILRAERDGGVWMAGSRLVAMARDQARLHADDRPVAPTVRLVDGATGCEWVFEAAVHATVDPLVAHLPAA